MGSSQKTIRTDSISSSTSTTNSFEVETVNDGQECVEYLAATDEHPTIVLLDVMLPRKNGLEVLEWIRRNDSSEIRTFQC